jgi:hypothetical protein
MSMRTPILTAALLALAALPLPARLFQPAEPPPRLEADGATVALYDFKAADLTKNEVPDTTGKSPAGQLQGKWELIAPEELHPSYENAGRTLSGGKKGKDRTQLVIKGLGDTLKAPFTVDVVLRWSRGGGHVLRVGNLALGVLHRGPGQFQLRLPVQQADGSFKPVVFESDALYEKLSPVRFDNFYTYSLSYDGDRTFKVWIDGTEAFSATVEEGKVALGDEVAVGNVETWKSESVGTEYAAVRISSEARAYQAAAQPETAFDKGAKRGWTFDAGKADSPLEPGAIRLTSADSYEAKRGYGWLNPVKGEFDEPIMADRYAATPEIGINKGSWRRVDALQRDGVVVDNGNLFKVDLPDGQYWVTAEIGHNRGSATIDQLTANGTEIGRKLATNQNTFNGHLNARTARGLVTVKGGQGLTLVAKTANATTGVPVRSITILPYAPVPIVFEQRKLVWKGNGAAPAELGAMNAAITQGDLAAAAAEARKIADPLARANALACVAGTPKLPESGDLALPDEIRQNLLKLVREQPDNVAARWLLDSTERFRHTLIAYISEGGSEVVVGSRFALWQGTGDLGLQLRPEDPEYWQGHFLAGAGIWQNGVQSSAFSQTGTTDKYVEDIERLQGFDAPGWIFRDVIAGWPDFRIARIMLGERLPASAAPWTPPANAPKWASQQNQLLQRIQETIHYWVNERMDSRGLLGGGLGDDVEALRWWTPGVVLGDDPTTISGWKRMSEAAWASTDGTGYSAHMDDVEHSAEPTGDPLPMLALLNYHTADMAKTQDRLGKTLPIFRDLWTTTTPEGFRTFKGYYFNNKQITRPGDVAYNIRAIKPLVWAAWVDPAQEELRGLLVDYARNWRHATMTEAGGKPKGIVPVLVKEGYTEFKEAGAKDWVQPGYQTYKYPGGYVAKAYELMLAAYEMSGDKTLLEPIQFALTELRKVPENDGDAAKYELGGFDWALRSGVKFIGVAGGDYRTITGDKSFDDVLMRWGPANVRYRIMAEHAASPAQFSQALAVLEQRLESGLEIMNSNPELRTTMMQSTDRIYAAGSLILTSMATGLAVPDSDLRGGEIVWPTFAVTWKGTDSQVAALVTEASPEKLEVLLYNFAPAPRALKPLVWRLKPGDYTLALSETDSSGFTVTKELFKRPQAISGTGQEVAFELPAQTPVRLSLSTGGVAKR